MNQTNIYTSTQSKAIFRVAGVMAILIVLVGLTDAITSTGVAAQDNRTIPVVEWFTLFQTSPFEAFSRLGFFNILTLSLGIPIYLAFTQAFRKDRSSLAVFASIVLFSGVTIYLSSNTVFPLFALSQQYAAASAAQKPLVEAAGNALLAQGADLTSGTFAGLFLAQIAGLLITATMLRGSVFGKWTALTGLIGFSLMSIFFILTAFFPAQYDTAIALSAPGGVILMAYQILLARKFFQLG